MTEILHLLKAPAPDTRTSAGESVRSGPPGAVGDSRPITIADAVNCLRQFEAECVRVLDADPSPFHFQGEPLDPTLPAWHAIHAGVRSFQQQIAKAETVNELVQLRERVTILSGELAELADIAGRLADQVIARRP